MEVQWGPKSEGQSQGHEGLVPGLVSSIALPNRIPGRRTGPGEACPRSSLLLAEYKRSTVG